MRKQKSEKVFAVVFILGTVRYNSGMAQLFRTLQHLNGQKLGVPMHLMSNNYRLKLVCIESSFKRIHNAAFFLFFDILRHFWEFLLLTKGFPYSIS